MYVIKSFLYCLICEIVVGVRTLGNTNDLIRTTLAAVGENLSLPDQ